MQPPGVVLNVSGRHYAVLKLLCTETAFEARSLDIINVLHGEKVVNLGRTALF